MAVSIEFQRRLRQAVAPVIGACVFGYFAYHAIHGDRGMMAWLQISQQLADSKAMLESLTAEREELQHRVSLLGSEGLDPDLLDERARIMLNVAKPDDRFVIINEIEPPH